MRTVRHPTAECRSELVRLVCGGKMQRRDASAAWRARAASYVQRADSKFALREFGVRALLPTYIPIALGALIHHKNIIIHSIL